MASKRTGDFMGFWLYVAFRAGVLDFQGVFYSTRIWGSFWVFSAECSRVFGALNLMKKEIFGAPTKTYTNHFNHY